MLELSHLVALCAGVQEALLDGELQQVVIFVPHRLAAARSEGGVIRWGLEHRGVHLTQEGRGRVTCENAFKKLEGSFLDVGTATSDKKQKSPALSVPSSLCTVTELTGSSQPHRLLNVTLAFNTWNRGISAKQPGLSG